MPSSTAPIEPATRATSATGAPAAGARPQGGGQAFAGTLDQVLAQPTDFAPPDPPQTGPFPDAKSATPDPASDQTAKPALPVPADLASLLLPPSTTQAGAAAAADGAKRASSASKPSATADAKSSVSADQRLDANGQAVSPQLPAGPSANLVVPAQPASPAPAVVTRPASLAGATSSLTPSQAKALADAPARSPATAHRQPPSALEPIAPDPDPAAKTSAPAPGAAPATSPSIAPTALAGSALTGFSVASSAPTPPARLDVPASSQPQSAPPPPAAQVADALTGPVQLSMASSPEPGGTRTLTIALKPAELGRVEIQIERSADGPAKIVLAVERPDTLMRLVQDQHHLQQALDQAGIPAAGRTVEFSLTSSGSDVSSQSSFSGGTGTSGNGGQKSQSNFTTPGSAAEDDAIHLLSGPALWSRTGLDITA